jgi:hypothetical protein
MASYWRFFGVPVAGACAALVSATPARADSFVQFIPGFPPNHYCADGADTNGLSASQHIAVHGGTLGLYIGSCRETLVYQGDPFLQQYDAPSQQFIDMPDAAAEYLSAAPTGGLWAVNDIGVISFWKGFTWIHLDGPAGRHPRQIAAASDSRAYVLADPAAGDHCLGGACIWQTVDGGQTWSILRPSIVAAQGAIAIAYDATTGNPWIISNINNQGHVLSFDPSVGRWLDRGLVGLPAYGAIAIAVCEGSPWVIGNATGSNLAGGGGVFTQLTSGGAWVQEGTGQGIQSATDIACDVNDRGPWIINYNGPFPGDKGGDNVWHWVFQR